MECWGDQPAGPIPYTKFLQLSVGDRKACAVNWQGHAYCFGSDEIATEPDGVFDEVAVGGRHACARRSDGTVACWGRDDYGQASPP
jgi:hypothetical protein